MQDEVYYPWGQAWRGGSYNFEPNYAGMGWYNAESDLFLTPARFYGSSPGRWISPDPLAGDITNPQSLNRYAYVLNNPTSMIDPTGLCPTWDPKCPGPGRSNNGGYNDAYGYSSPCTNTFDGGCPPPNASQEAAAAEAQYMVNNNMCLGGCGGLTYATGGLTYTWVPTAVVGVNIGGAGKIWGDLSPG